jgi:hypothetical protein
MKNPMKTAAAVAFLCVGGEFWTSDLETRPIKAKMRKTVWGEFCASSAKPDENRCD